VLRPARHLVAHIKLRTCQTGITDTAGLPLSPSGRRSTTCSTQRSSTSWTRQHRGSACAAPSDLTETRIELCGELINDLRDRVGDALKRHYADEADDRFTAQLAIGGTVLACLIIGVLYLWLR
jgi:hypothetical protein